MLPQCDPSGINIHVAFRMSHVAFFIFSCLPAGRIFHLNSIPLKLKANSKGQQLIFASHLRKLVRPPEDLHKKKMTYLYVILKICRIFTPNSELCLNQKLNYLIKNCRIMLHFSRLYRTPQGLRSFYTLLNVKPVSLVIFQTYCLLEGQP